MVMVSLTIDGQKVDAPAGSTVLQAARIAGIDIPTLCDHPAVAPIGACRICLVEISGQRALQPACTYPITDGMQVQTESPPVVQSRKFALNLLFSERNHFCMYCEVSGDCELQDLGYRYGLDHWIHPTYTRPFPVDASRKTFIMEHNRCVLCRRCVRACSELVANHTLGVNERGARTMIGADIDRPFGDSSCISCGTCLQVCPTGSLIDKRSAFMGRSSQNESTKSVCSQCSVGCGTQVIVRGCAVLRLEGDWDATPNGGLLCEKGRFDPLYDERPRLTQPMIRRNGSLAAVGWDTALDEAARRLANSSAGKVGLLASTNATNEALYLLGDLFGQKLGVENCSLLDDTITARLEPQGSLADITKADVILVAGVDPVTDQPVASFLIKRAADRGAQLIVVDGKENALAGFASESLTFSELGHALDTVAQASRPVIVYGAGLPRGVVEALGAVQALQGMERARFVALERGVNTRAAVGLGLDRKCDVQSLDTVYVLLGEQSLNGRAVLDDAPAGVFTIVQASFASPLTERADIVLPMAVWSERSGSLINTEGRILHASQAVEPAGEAKADWQILSLLAEKLGRPVADSLEGLTALATEQLRSQENR